MSQPMQIIKSRLEEIDDLGQPIESPKPPPPPSIRTGAKPPSRAGTPARHIDHEEDPYKPEHYEVEIFRLMEETIEGRKKPARFTVLDNALVQRFVSPYQVKPPVAGKAVAHRIVVRIAWDAG